MYSSEGSWCYQELKQEGLLLVVTELTKRESIVLLVACQQREATIVSANMCFTDNIGIEMRRSTPIMFYLHDKLAETLVNTEIFCEDTFSLRICTTAIYCCR